MEINIAYTLKKCVKIWSANRFALLFLKEVFKAVSKSLFNIIYIHIK
jgi:hypothetical protein